MDVIEEIKKKISSSINVSHLEIIDDSGAHAGHIFYSVSPISHILIKVVSDDFLQINKLNRQKLLHQIVKDEIQLIHSVSFRLYTESEYGMIKV